MAKKYYAVKKGLMTGIVESWEECKSWVTGYPGAQYKGFATFAEAEAYIDGSVVVAKKKSTRTTINQNNKTYKVDHGKFNSEVQIYYVVGIFNTWKECEEQVKGYPGAQYKKVTGKSLALEYLHQGNIKIIEEKIKVKPAKQTKAIKQIGKINTNKINKVGYDVEPIKSKAKVRSSKSYINPSEINKDFEYIAFIDGSYDKKNKIFGSGVVVLSDNLTDYETFYESGYDEWDQWNIVGELEATKLALKKAEEIGAKNIAIYHDLKNISLWATGEWKAKNRYTQEYVRFIEEYSERLNIYFIKVKAHSNESAYNDLADEAAKSAITRYIK